MYYIKNGRKYIPVERFSGFPADGIWLVRREGHLSTCIVKLGDTPPPMSILPYAALSVQCCEYLVYKAKEKKAYSFMDVAEWAAEFYALAADKQLPKGREW